MRRVRRIYATDYFPGTLHFPMRGLIDNKGEHFANLEGDQLLTLEGELSGYLRGDFIVDLNGSKVWLVIGDGVYRLDGIHQVGFFGGEKPAEYY